MRWLIFLFPWLELWTLIELGGAIGGLGALLYVFFTLVLGMSLVRRQGVALVRQMQQQMQEQGGMAMGPQLLGDELAVVGSGMLLMIPGLITDVLALLLLIGPLRRRALRLLQGGRADHSPAGHGHSPPRPSGGDTIEGEFRRLDD